MPKYHIHIHVALWGQNHINQKFHIAGDLVEEITSLTLHNMKWKFDNLDA